MGTPQNLHSAGTPRAVCKEFLTWAGKWPGPGHRRLGPDRLPPARKVQARPVRKLQASSSSVWPMPFWKFRPGRKVQADFSSERSSGQASLKSSGQFDFGLAQAEKFKPRLQTPQILRSADTFLIGFPMGIYENTTFLRSAGTFH